MIKNLLLASTLLVGLGATAQSNLDFEGTNTPNSFFGDQPDGWFGVGTTLETAAPGQGSQSYTLTTANNPAFAYTFSQPSDTIGGLLLQTINSPGAGLTSVDFMYKYNSVNGDSAVFLVEIVDTMLAGNSDDVILDQGLYIIPATQTTWTTVNVPVNNFNTGTAHELNLSFVASGASAFGTAPAGAPFTFPLPSPGTALTVDGVVLNGYVGVNDYALNPTIKAFPNPASDKVNFTFDGMENGTVKVYNIAGQLVKNENFNTNTVVLNVSDLENGVYLYNITDEKGNVVKQDKIVVNK